MAECALTPRVSEGIAVLEIYSSQFSERDDVQSQPDSVSRVLGKPRHSRGGNAEDVRHP